MVNRHSQPPAEWPRCGRAKGNQGAQKPPRGKTVRSTCQRWFGRLAVTIRDVLASMACSAGASAGPGLLGVAFSMRPTVVTPRCRPARAKICASLTLPRAGHRALSRRTTTLGQP